MAYATSPGSVLEVQLSLLAAMIEILDELYGEKKEEKEDTMREYIYLDGKDSIHDVINMLESGGIKVKNKNSLHNLNWLSDNPFGVCVKGNVANIIIDFEPYRTAEALKDLIAERVNHTFKSSSIYICTSREFLENPNFIAHWNKPKKYYLSIEEAGNPYCIKTEIMITESDKEMILNQLRSNNAI